jgi:hypothetical protein
MKADYLTLTNDRKVRILWNMNALGEFTRITGKDITDFIDGRADVNTLRAIAWCSAVEGEEDEGRSLDLTEKEFGRLIDMRGMIEFSKILTEQSSNDGQKKSPLQEKFPKIFYRKKG